jgi:hypothetical protein
MVETTPVQNDVKDASDFVGPALNQLRAAQSLSKQNRTQGLSALNTLFRAGTLPAPALNGRHQGELIALDIAPGLTQFFDWTSSMWMPWLGKTFDASRQSGDNIFTRDSYALARFFNPLYWGFVTEGSKTYRCFTFRTYTAPGLTDPDRMVLKIDYDMKENPSSTIRRILDELVQVDSNLYLGKAHAHWWTGGWQTVAYFMLRSPASETSDPT